MSEIPIPEMPFMAMSGAELAFGVMQLADALIERTERLTSVSVFTEISRRGSDQFNDAGFPGESSLPYIRALMGHYATLLIAKEYPDWEGDQERGRDHVSDFTLNADGNNSAYFAVKIKEKCRRLGCIDFVEIASTLRDLDLLLAKHAQICGEIWPKLYAKARECEALP